MHQFFMLPVFINFVLYISYCKCSLQAISFFCLEHSAIGGCMASIGAAEGVFTMDATNQPSYMSKEAQAKMENDFHNGG